MGKIVKAAVIGIGQSLRGDDAAGLEAVRLWQEKYPRSASLLQVEQVELPGLSLLDLLEGLDAAILVDAVRSESPPGTLLRLGPEEVASFSADARSAHGWGVAETLHLGRLLMMQCRLTLIGIVGMDFLPGAPLSPQVRAALPHAADQIEEEARALI